MCPGREPRKIAFMLLFIVVESYFFCLLLEDIHIYDNIYHIKHTVLIGKTQ